MNVRPGSFISAIGRSLLALVASCLALGAGVTHAGPPVLTSDASSQTTGAIAGAEHRAVWPTFKGIPPAPKDVRSLAAWKKAVVEIESNGRQVTQMATAEPWTLSDTEAWAAQQRAAATPPPPITSANDADTAAAVAAMRERAKEPPRSH